MKPATTNPQKNIKTIEMKEARERVATFTQLTKERQQAGLMKKSFETAQDLQDSINEFLEVAFQTGISPDISGFCIYAGIGRQTFYAMMEVGDERSDICKKYREYIDFYHSQIGLMQSTNPAFNVFYAKSRLGWREENTLDINVNYPTGIQAFNPQDLLELVENTPIETEYTELDN